MTALSGAGSGGGLLLLLLLLLQLLACVPVKCGAVACYLAPTAAGAAAGCRAALLFAMEGGRQAGSLQLLLLLPGLLLVLVSSIFT